MPFTQKKPKSDFPGEEGRVDTRRSPFLQILKRTQERTQQAVKRPTEEEIMILEHQVQRVEVSRIDTPELIEGFHPVLYPLFSISSLDSIQQSQQTFSENPILGAH